MSQIDNNTVEENGVLTTPNNNDLTSLTHALVEWRRLNDELSELRQQVREKNKRGKALEDVILRVMKNNNIGALDLTSSGGRVLFRKQKRQGALGQKNMMKFMAEHLKSEDKAKEMMTFIQSRRDVVTKESLLYEKTD
jgi:hypothetical protein